MVCRTQPVLVPFGAVSPTIGNVNTLTLLSASVHARRLSGSVPTLVVIVGISEHVRFDARCVKVRTTRHDVPHVTPHVPYVRRSPARLTGSVASTGSR